MNRRRTKREWLRRPSGMFSMAQARELIDTLAGDRDALLAERNALLALLEEAADEMRWVARHDLTVRELLGRVDAAIAAARGGT